MSKMKCSSLLLTCIFLVVVTLSFIGCQQPPKQEKNDAELAEKDAIAANAEKLVPEEYQAATDEKQDAETEMASKNYEKAKTVFISAKEKFIAAKDSATKRLEEIKGEIEGLSQKAAETKGTVSQLVDSASSACIKDAFKNVLGKIKDKNKKKEAKTKIDELTKQLKTEFDTNLTGAKDKLAQTDTLIQEASELAGDETVLDKKEKLDNAIKQLEDIKGSLEAPCNTAKAEAEKLTGETPQPQAQ